MPVTHQSTEKDAYDIGVSNHDRNASAASRFSFFMFVFGGFMLTLIEGFTS